MWEFYLAGAEVAFRNEFQIVFQIQITRDQEAVPLTRDYITDWERQHSAPPTNSSDNAENSKRRHNTG